MSLTPREKYPDDLVGQEPYRRCRWQTWRVKRLRVDKSAVHCCRDRPSITREEFIKPVETLPHRLRANELNSINYHAKQPRLLSSLTVDALINTHEYLSFIGIMTAASQGSWDMYTRTLLFTAALGLCLTGCNVKQGNNSVAASEECGDLVNRGLIGQNGPEVCVTTPLSKSDTSISGSVVGAGSTGPFMVTALTTDGILKQAITLENGDFTMSSLNLQNLPGKNISFSVFVNNTSSPVTNLVVGQEPGSKCAVGTPDYPSCGTHPGAIFFPIKSSVTAIIRVPTGEVFGGASLLPYTIGLNPIISWKPDRYLAFYRDLPSPITPGDELTIFAVNYHNESFAYTVKQTVLPTKK